MTFHIQAPFFEFEEWLELHLLILKNTIRKDKK